MASYRQQLSFTSCGHARNTLGPGLFAVVVGAGYSGTAACRLLHALGVKVRLVDRNPQAVDAEFVAWANTSAVEIVGGDHCAEQFTGADVIIMSPGAPVAAVRHVVSKAVTDEAGSGPEIIAETEFAWRLLQGEPVLGVTGTSGKTTIVTMCAAMLREQGLKVFLGGNIGTPLSKYVLDVRSGTARADVLVLELSSFQLQACTTLHPRVAVLTGVTPNHLDYHADMQEYTDAKMRLFRCQSAQDTAIFAEDVMSLAKEYGVVARQEVVRMTHPPRFTQMKFFGAHNALNAETAWLACKPFGVSETAARRAVAELEPIAHRLERITEKQGVVYVNDSKCTTVPALTVALEAFDRPVLLLAGGKFKGGDLESLRPLLAKRVRAVALYGASREVFEAAWQGTVPMSYDTTLEEATKRAAGLAHAGDVVLLAPATASFDQYLNYIARGDDFRRIATEVLV